MSSQILECPECERRFRYESDGVYPEDITCPECGRKRPAPDFSVLVLCTNCSTKLSVPLDTVEEPDLTCPKCGAGISIGEENLLTTFGENFSTFDGMGEDRHQMFHRMLNDGDLFDKYRIIRLLGRGGMADVYLAEHLLLKQKCALKLMRSGLNSGDPVFIKRFMREARLSHKFNHPNIVRVFDAGSDPKTGYLFIAMEYVEGKTLMDLLKESQGPLSENVLMQVLNSMTQALKVLHDAGVVHRDIKPSNIMLTKDGLYKLMDLGIAKTDSSQQGEMTLTMDQSAIGTPGYASPEQCRSAHLVDIRSDIYCLGATLYHLASGELPFTGNTPLEIILKVLQSETVPLGKYRPDLSEKMLKIIDSMMKKDPDDRPDDPEALERMIAGESPFTCWKWLKKILHFLTLLKYLVLACVILGIGAYIFFTRSEQPRADEADPEKRPKSSEEKHPPIPEKDAVHQTAAPPQVQIDPKAPPGSPTGTTSKTSESKPAQEKNDSAAAAKPGSIEERIGHVNKRLGELKKELADCTDSDKRAWLNKKIETRTEQLRRLKGQREVLERAKHLDHSQFDAERMEKFKQEFTEYTIQRSNMREDDPVSIDFANWLLEALKSGKIDPDIEVADGRNTVFSGPLLKWVMHSRLPHGEEITRQLIKLGANTSGFRIFDIFMSNHIKTPPSWIVLTEGGCDNMSGYLLRYMGRLSIPEELVTKMLYLDHSVSESDSMGYTALHYAARAGSKDLVELLLLLDADVNARNMQGETPLFSAMDGRHLAVCDMLIKAGADRNIKNNNGETVADRNIGNNSGKAADRNIGNNSGKAQADRNIENNSGKAQAAVMTATVGQTDKATEKMGSIEERIDHVKTRLHELRRELGRNTKSDKRAWLNKKIEIRTEQLRRLKEQLAVRERAKHLDRSQFDADRMEKFKQKFGEYTSRRRAILGEDPVSVEFANWLLAELRSGKIDPNIEVSDIKYHKFSGPLLQWAIHGSTRHAEEIVRQLIELGADSSRSRISFGFAGGRLIQTPGIVLTEGGCNVLRGYLLRYMKLQPIPEKLITKILYLDHRVDESDNLGNTALHYAARSGLKDLVELLLLLDADANARNELGETPLFSAMKSGQKAVSNMLISAGADRSIKDNSGQTAANMAADTGRIQYIEERIEHVKTRLNELKRELGRNTKSDKRAWLNKKIEIRTEQLRRLKEQLAVRERAKHLDRSKFDAARMETFKKKFAEYTRQHRNGGYNPADADFARWMLEELKSGKIDPNIEVVDSNGSVYSGPLLKSVMSGLFDRNLEADLARLLIKLGADTSQLFNASVNYFGTEALWIVLTEGGCDFHTGYILKHMKRLPVPKAQITKLLYLDHRVDETDEQGNTALHYAARFGLTDIVELLLLLDANPNARNKLGETPLFPAVETGQQAVCDMLIKAGAKRNIRNLGGKTVASMADVGRLQYAITKGMLKDVESLLKKGIGPNTRFSNDYTALQTACLQKNFQMVKLLLDRGADPNLGCTTGGNRKSYPLQLAFDKQAARDPKIFSLLLKRGADPNVPPNGLGGDVTLLILMCDRYSNIGGPEDREFFEALLDNPRTRLEATLRGRTVSVLFLAIGNQRPAWFIKRILDRISSFEQWDPVVTLAVVNDYTDDVIKTLIDKGAAVNVPYTPNVKNNNGETIALYEAVKKKRLNVVKMLLANGADPDWKSPDGKSIRELDTTPQIRALLK